MTIQHGKTILNTIAISSPRTNRAALIFLLLLIILGSLFRFAFFSSHFSQDDEAIHLITRLDEYQKSLYAVTIGPEETGIINDSDTKQIHLFSQSPFSHEFMITPDDIRNNPILYSLRMSHQVTYAPFYSFMAGFLIDDDDPYEKRSMQLRLPNLFFSILSILLFSLLMFRLDNTLISGLLPVSIFSFSIITIVYASQGIPYALLIFLTILQMLLIQNMESQKKFKIKHALAAAVLAVVTGYAHWMMLLSNIVFYLVIMTVLLLYCKKEEKMKHLLRLAFSFVCYSALMIPGILLFVLKKMEETSVRPDFQVGFDIELLKRIYLIVTSNLSIRPEGSLINIILVYTVMLVIMWGAACLFRSQYSAPKAVMIYSMLIPAAYVAAGIAGFVPITPTRHTIFFVPLLLYMTGYGLNAVLSLFKENSPASLRCRFLVYGVTAAILFSAVTGFADLHKDRKAALDKAALSHIEDLISKYNVQQVIAFESMEAQLVLKEALGIPVRLYTKAGYFDTRELTDEPGTVDTILFISTARRLDESNPDFMHIIDMLYEREPSITEEIAVKGVSMDTVSGYNDTNVFNNLYVTVAGVTAR